MAILVSDKKTLRQQAKEKLKIVFADRDDVYQRQSKLIQKFEENNIFVNAKTILTYYPIEFEFDLSSLLITNPDKRWVLPRPIGGSRMLLFEAGDLFNLVELKHGVKAPYATSPLVKPEEIDLVIVPALAYDKQNYRLGRGGGYYDRLLGNLSKKTKVVGVIPKELVLTEVYKEAHDKAVKTVFAV